MKKTALSVALLVSTSVSAGTFNSSLEVGNSDLYDGWLIHSSCRL